MSHCGLPLDPGFGEASVESFHYDGATGKCVRFEYKGSGGNDNRYVMAGTIN